MLSTKNNHNFFFMDKGIEKGRCIIRSSIDKASLWNFEINPEERGKGFGKQFLEEIVEYIKDLNISRLELGVYSDNIIALNLYQKFGFKENYPEINEKRVVWMILDL